MGSTILFHQGEKSKLLCFDLSANTAENGFPLKYAQHIAASGGGGCCSKASINRFVKHQRLFHSQSQPATRATIYKAQDRMQIFITAFPLRWLVHHFTSLGLTFFFCFRNFPNQTTNSCTFRFGHHLLEANQTRQYLPAGCTTTVGGQTERKFAWEQLFRCPTIYSFHISKFQLIPGRAGQYNVLYMFFNFAHN